MYIVIDVQIPEKLTKEQKRLIEQLNDTVLTSNKINKFNRYVKNTSNRALFLICLDKKKKILIQ